MHIQKGQSTNLCYFAIISTKDRSLKIEDTLIITDFLFLGEPLHQGIHTKCITIEHWMALWDTSGQT